MTAIPRPATRQEWLDARRPYVGASEASILINRNRYDNLADYAVRKIKGIDVPESKAMRRGNTLEAAVASLWMDDSGIQVVPASVLYVNGPFMATPDFEPLQFDADWLLEVKTARAYVDYLPDDWKCQGYVQAYCAGRTGIHFAVLDMSMLCKSFYLDCTTDEARLCIETLVPAAERFLGYVREGKIPEGLELTEWAVKALFPRAEQKTVEIDASTLSWVKELADAREIKNAAEKREKAAKNALAAALVDAAQAQYEGTTVLTWANNKDSVGFDKELFEQEHPGLLDDPRYQRPITGPRVMRTPQSGKAVLETMPWAQEETW